MALKVGMDLGFGMGLGQVRAGVVDGFGAGDRTEFSSGWRWDRDEFGVRIGLGLELR